MTDMTGLTGVKLNEDLVQSLLYCEHLVFLRPPLGVLAKTELRLADSDPKSSARNPASEAQILTSGLRPYK